MAEIPQLARLEPVTITSVWASEPHHFTPWLLANADRLGEALGLDIELTSREHKVGKFFLDLIGRDLTNDGTLIVENQFGKTDHGHLGQLLTYAGGTEPTTIVWIAETFAQDHRAALGWLNRHTVDDVRFFGVEIKAVTLTGAPPGLVAPMFDVVAEPNEWERRVRDETNEAKSSRSELYREFWSELLPLAKSRGWTHGSAPAQNWWTMPTGTSDIAWGVSFASFGARSELYFGSSDPEVNTARFLAVLERRDVVEQAFGGQLEFDELPAAKACRIEVRLPNASVDRRAEWSTYVDWFMDTQTRLRAAIEAIGGIRQLAP